MGEIRITIRITITIGEMEWWGDGEMGRIDHG